MPEIQLSLGRVPGELGGIQREWLVWHDASGQPYPLPQELISSFRANSAGTAAGCCTGLYRGDERLKVYPASAPGDLPFTV